MTVPRVSAITRVNCNDGHITEMLACAYRDCVVVKTSFAGTLNLFLVSVAVVVGSRFNNKASPFALLIECEIAEHANFVFSVNKTNGCTQHGEIKAPPRCKNL